VELTYFRRWIKSDEKINSLKIYKLFFLDEVKIMDFREEMQTSPLFSFLGRIPCINTKGVRIDYLTFFYTM
jgi:hypothetical protein